MGEKTGIQWCDHTFNPWWGCTKTADPGCDNCYAAVQAARYGHRVWGPDAERLLFSDKHFDFPIHWNAAAKAAGVRRRVFCGSMCDIFEHRLDLEKPAAQNT